MMSIEEIIQQEYEAVNSGKLPFELMLTDCYDYLVSRKLLIPTIKSIRYATVFVNQYRMLARRRDYRLQEDPRPPILFTPDKETKRRQEESFKKNLVKKVLVSNWYDAQRLAGRNKLFLELPETV